MTLTNLFTKNGRTFVPVGCNLRIRNTFYLNVQPDTLQSLGYHQVVNVEVEVLALYTDGFETREGETYWVHYVQAPEPEPEVEPETEE